MTDAAKILSLIENVSPDDTAALDEIDARVELFIRPYVTGGYDYHEYTNNYDCNCSHCPNQHLVVKEGDGGSGMYIRVNQYTRDRNALKSIRPDGWTFHVDATAPELGVTYVFSNDVHEVKGDLYRAHTYGEELAELSAILQAIEWERQNAK